MFTRRVLTTSLLAIRGLCPEWVGSYRAVPLPSNRPEPPPALAPVRSSQQVPADAEPGPRDYPNENQWHQRAKQSGSGPVPGKAAGRESKDRKSVV